MNSTLGCSPSLPAALDAMLQSLEAQCRMTTQLVALAQPAPSESDADLLAFAAQVEQLEAMLAAHDAAMDAEEEAMQHAQEVALPELRELNQQLQAQQQSVVENAALIAAHSQPAASRQPLSNSNKTNTQSASKPASAKKSGSTKSDKPSSSSTGAPSISPSKLRLEAVSAEEFTSIPSYMRGRLDRAKLQAALETWGTLLRAKYTLMATPAAQQSEAQRKQVAAWLAEETEETTGCAFLSSEDVRQCAELQALGSINLKAVLVGLRHLGRVKNSTASGAPKYILL